MSVGRRSRRVDSIWPNLTKIGPERLEREAQAHRARCRQVAPEQHAPRPTAAGRARARASSTMSSSPKRSATVVMRARRRILIRSLYVWVRHGFRLAAGSALAARSIGHALEPRAPASEHELGRGAFARARLLGTLAPAATPAAARRRSLRIARSARHRGAPAARAFARRALAGAHLGSHRELDVRPLGRLARRHVRRRRTPTGPSDARSGRTRAGPARACRAARTTASAGASSGRFAVLTHCVLGHVLHVHAQVRRIGRAPVAAPAERVAREPVLLRHLAAASARSPACGSRCSRRSSRCSGRARRSGVGLSARRCGGTANAAAANAAPSTMLRNVDMMSPWFEFGVLVDQAAVRASQVRDQRADGRMHVARQHPPELAIGVGHGRLAREREPARERRACASAYAAYAARVSASCTSTALERRELGASVRRARRRAA